ncbi:hypothetical protein [Treponema brennaborense]|uniref:OstA family protein n=1 Tax=Treponema brennaborense (strain DSM 12168 / CIP 105900 / DD5/3) TaxID=906968 RepID=F4LIV7_TREBD|nr:hypothetical protein [Treponema brennaborense]AEE16282.1 hypothetical protein Trebr_0846 [Treponema brennaborense DSM 12168]
MRFGAGGFLPRRFLRSVCACAVLLCALPAEPLAAAENGGSTVTIEQARKTEYQNDKETGSEIIVFSGDVKVSVERDGTVNVICADTVNYDRKRSMLYAQGNVTLDKTGSDRQTEHLTAESLLFNVQTLEGIFNDGRVVQAQSAALNLPADSTLIVSSDLFSRNGSGTIAFKKGSLTFCDEEDPHWKIKASRIWLLPGNEFAFINALLFVGHVPVMYFPFFYYPKNELVFNPVFGYRQREGYFIQTTTYLIGRKPLEKTDAKDDSLFNFMKPTTLKKQQLEGLVLRNLDEDETDVSPHTLKLTADYYTNLGGMFGVSGAFKPHKNIPNVDFSVYTGFSRTLFPSSTASIYTPYGADGNTYYDSSAFMGLKLPFRFKADFQMKVTAPFSLTVSLPLYSDPFFNIDFLDRSETMDWINFFISNPALTVSDTDSTAAKGEISSFTWQLSGSYRKNLSLPNPLSFSVSASSSVLFSSKADPTLSSVISSYSPNRKFFYPSLIKPFSFDTTLSGTLFSYPKTDTAVSARKDPAVRLPAELRPPAELAPAEPAPITEPAAGVPADDGSASGAPADDTAPLSAEPAAGAPADDGSVLPETAFPALTVTAPSAANVGSLSYSLKYSIAPSVSSEISYTAPNRSDDFSWDDVRSTFVLFKSPIKLDSALSYRDSFVSLSNSLSFSPVIQRHPLYRNDSDRNTVVKNDYAAQKMDLVNTNALSFKPFTYFDLLKNTSVSWNTGIKLLRTNFIGSADDPQWEYLFPEWNEDSFQTHTLNVSFAAEQGSYSQKLVLTTNLPPLVDSYGAVLTLGFPVATVSAGSGIKQTSSTDTSWKLQPFTQSASVHLFSKKLSLTQNFSYNLEDKHPSSFLFSISAFDLSLQYSMQYTNSYTFSTTAGWTAESDKRFMPVSVVLKYASKEHKFRTWKNRVLFSPRLSTELSYDMIRPTNSYFVFQPSFTFTINEFLNLTFSSSSRNNVVYRYVQDLADTDPKIPGETNILKDLWNSFAFWDDTLRTSSGFKLKSLAVKLTHELHDWQLSSEFKIEPRIITDGSLKRFDFSPYFTLSVLWRPMQSIKTTIEDKYGTFTLNP